MKNPVYEFLDGKNVEYNGTRGVFKVHEDINGQRLLFVHNAHEPIDLSNDFTTYVDAATQLGYEYKDEHKAMFKGRDLYKFLGAVQFVKMLGDRTDLRLDPQFKTYAVESERVCGGPMFWLMFATAEELAADFNAFKLVM